MSASTIRSPSSRWRPSVRPYPEPRRPKYTDHMEVRRISTAGTFSWGGAAAFSPRPSRGEDIGLEEVLEGIRNIVYYRTLLGRIDVRSGHLTGL